MREMVPPGCPWRPGPAPRGYGTGRRDIAAGRRDIAAARRTPARAGAAVQHRAHAGSSPPRSLSRRRRAGVPGHRGGRDAGPLTAPLPAAGVGDTVVSLGPGSTPGSAAGLSLRLAGAGGVASPPPPFGRAPCRPHRREGGCVGVGVPSRSGVPGHGCGGVRVCVCVSLLGTNYKLNG